MRFLALLLLLALPACASPLQSVSAQLLPEKSENGISFLFDMKSSNGKEFSQNQITRSALGLLLIEDTTLFFHPTNGCLAFSGTGTTRHGTEALLGTMCCEVTDVKGTQHVCHLKLEEKSW